MFTYWQKMAADLLAILTEIRDDLRAIRERMEA